MTLSLFNLILDAGPIISNTALPQAGSYYTTPAVIAELKDESARARLQSLHALQIRTPTKQSLEFCRTFAKQTGDAEVLSATDIGIIALTYELECEMNGGDWRLKNVPGQIRINGKPPVHEKSSVEAVTTQAANPAESQESFVAGSEQSLQRLSLEDCKTDLSADTHREAPIDHGTLSVAEIGLDENLAPSEHNVLNDGLGEAHKVVEVGDEEEDDDDDDDWITPSNIKAKQEQAANPDDATAQETKTMKVACSSHDFAMQNVLLQIGLNLVSGDGKRITSVKTWILRCHACFKTTRNMALKFCPSCGGATLMRTSVSTDSKGAMKIHLKRNMQWNNRGTVFSIPKQRHGTANMKGRDNLILRADQREVEKLEKRDKYKKEYDLLDPDYIPSIVSGRRDMHSSSIKVGHGRRNPNSNRKH